jgi:hypothetical protein
MVVGLVSALAMTAQSAAAQTPAPPAPSTAPATAPAAAADPLDGWTLSGTLEAYYQWNANRPSDRVNLLRAYDTRANVFGLQQAAIVLENAPDVAAGRRAGLRLDLQFGQATETVQGGLANEPRPEVYRHVWQAYGTYVFAMKRDVQVDFGKFASSLGYETNYAKDNNNFSRAYLFNFLPFYHSGVKATLPVNDKITLFYALTNGIQQTEDFNNFKSSQFAGIIKPTSKIVWTINYYVGQEQQDGGQPNGPDGFFKVFDTYLSYAATDALTVAVDVSHVTNEVTKVSDAGALTGLGAYLRYQLKPLAALALRYEYLDDDGGLFGGVPQTLQEVTLTAERRLSDSFMARAEFRSDWSDREFFTSDNDTLKKTQNTFLVGLVWWMGGKKGAW